MTKPVTSSSWKKTKRNKFGENDDEFCFVTMSERFVRHSCGEDPVDNWIDETRIQEKFCTRDKDS